MQIVRFGLADETYGLEIDTIQEIIMDKKITHVPNVASFLRGIINLRNLVIPVVEGAERLGYSQEQIPEQGTGRILIVEFENQLIGIRVRSAETVLEIDEQRVQSSPKMIDSMGGEFVRGVVEYRQQDRDKETGGSSGTDQSIRGLDFSELSSDSEQSSASENQMMDSELGNENILLLNLDKLFTGSEIEEIKQAKQVSDTESPPADQEKST